MGQRDSLNIYMLRLLTIAWLISSTTAVMDVAKKPSFSSRRLLVDTIGAPSPADVALVPGPVVPPTAGAPHPWGLLQWPFSSIISMPPSGAPFRGKGDYLAFHPLGPSPPAENGSIDPIPPTSAVVKT